MRVLLLGFSVLALAACNASHDAPASPPVASASTAPATPKAPHNPSDINAWREFAAASAPHVTDGQHVYSFVVPPGDTADAKDQRTRMVGAIKAMIGHGASLPGNAIVIAGPDGRAAAEVVVAAYKDESKEAFKGMTVRFVADGGTDVSAARSAVEAAGGTFEWVKPRAG